MFESLCTAFLSKCKMHNLYIRTNIRNYGTKKMLYFLQPEIIQRKKKRRKQRIVKGTRQTRVSLMSAMMKSTNWKKWWRSSSQSIGAMPTGEFECYLKLSIILSEVVDAKQMHAWLQGLLIPWTLTIIYLHPFTDS